MRVPMFGNRRLLRAEERDEENNQYALLGRAGIRHPRSFARPGEIDRLVMVKAPHAKVTFERAFFLCSSPPGVRARGGAADRCRHGERGRSAVGADRGVRARPERQPEFLLLAAPWRGRVARHRHAPSDEPRRIAVPAARATRGRGGDAGADGRGGAHRDDADRVDVGEGVRDGRTLRVRGARRAGRPACIGPFALQCVIAAGPPKEFVVYDVSLRIPGSPGDALSRRIARISGAATSRSASGSRWRSWPRATPAGWRISLRNTGRDDERSSRRCRRPGPPQGQRARGRADRPSRADRSRSPRPARESRARPCASCC